jgi:hypothetical protein
MMSSDSLSGSVFAIDVDGRPVLMFSTKFYSQAEAICSDPRIRTKLKAVVSDGKPLCDDAAKLRVRLARLEERQKYLDEADARTGEQVLQLVYLVALDEVSAADNKAAVVD